ncbi:protein of unknown function [Taphrina deformans PYCC 5710]|uniref:Mannosyltransferase n=1 Tax=Taphrina deformans (strain PYCC 5710 / ATCC 11124 / CBS 356.35 / IMI 108563 / JCM 9778 / NBRC 8474) TaxID=1097556 RepID=R4XFK1_TAPDE|nr:protein of unknown function [Taphrina deformans PYCC 5710]|eukprot:CCG84541.1 protein of unknown function [Taphrina deformans PYCC 5710]
MAVAKFWHIYAGLLLVRLCIALSKSYIHPDEMFQGSEIIVGDIFSWPIFKTWEFTSTSPIRSIVPIYFFQSPLLYHLRFFTSVDSGRLIFYTLRLQQFLWSLVIDVLIYTITKSQLTMLLFASSYTTLAYHTHTFSNSWETILVLGALVASQGDNVSLLLGPITCLGMFTRISYPAFMLPLAVTRVRAMLVRTKQKEWAIDEDQIQFNAFSLTTFCLVALIMVYLDTLYYTGNWLTPFNLNRTVMTVLNNLSYNTNVSNLSEHGIHPRYTHILNLILLLGPGILLVPRLRKNIYTASMFSGLFLLSVAPHQEARFLLPCVALFFAGLKTRKLSGMFWTIWLVFNFAMTIFMGVFHQCGVIPVALHIGNAYPNTTVTWTKSYPAPTLLLGPHARVKHVYGTLTEAPDSELYVAPLSDPVRYEGYNLVFSEKWHVNLDDFDVLGMDVFKHRSLGVYKRHQAL